MSVGPDNARPEPVGPGPQPALVVRQERRAQTAEVMLITSRGGPEVLQPSEITLAAPGPHEVMIRVQAGGVALGDVMLREGIRRDVPLPAVPGYDVAGTVTTVGEEVRDVVVGQQVIGWTGGSGGYATHALLPDWAVVPAPAGPEPAEAVAMVLNYLTAWQMLARASSVGPGDRILVHGGAGGVGTALLQLAALLDLQVLTTVSTAKRATVEALGATPIDYRTEDVTGRVRALAPGGLDAIYDPLGSTSWRQSLHLLRPGGRLIVYGVTTTLPGGRRSLRQLASTVLRAPRTSYLTYALNGIGVTGYHIVKQTLAHPGWYRNDMTLLLDHLAAGRIRPLIADTLPLHDAATAHRRLGTSNHIGKLILTM